MPNQCNYPKFRDGFIGLAAEVEIHVESIDRAIDYQA